MRSWLLIPLLLWISKKRPIPGAATAHFIFWYASLRLFVDLFRDYPSHRLALGTGQTLNIVMTIVGVALIVRSEIRWRAREHAPSEEEPTPRPVHHAHLAIKRVAFAALLLSCLSIPGNWTQDIPARYGKRHAGLRHSALYPAIDTSRRPLER